jgi:hypothetical protein
MIRPFGSNLAFSTMAIPYINVVGLGVPGSQAFGKWGPGNFTQTTFGWRDILSDTIKNHTLKVGFQMNNIREYDSQSGAQDRPTFTFNNLRSFDIHRAAEEGPAHAGSTQLPARDKFRDGSRSPAARCRRPARDQLPSARS